MKRREGKVRAVLGQWYYAAPQFAQNILAKEKKQLGKVVYVHPKGRFAVLEFAGIYGRPRESFYGEDLTQPAPRPREAW